MAEVPITALESRQQKMVENARVALERTNFDYVIEVTTQVLKASPGCLPVRRLQRVAQLRQARAAKGGFMAKVSSGLSTAPFMFGGGRKDPARLLAAAEASLARDPTNVVALKLLAEAAQGLGLRETAAFALDAVREIEPANRANLLALGEAWFAAGFMADALKAADEILRLDPVSPEAQALMRKASVAQTVAKVGWEKAGTFREKLRMEPAAVAPAAGEGLTNSAATTRSALAEALAAAGREPQNLNHHRTVAQAYRQLGNLDAALEWIRKARQQPAGRTDPTLEKQESELATAVLEQRAGVAGTAAAAAPGDAARQAQAAAARVELTAFKLAEARRAVERYPNDAAARYSLGALLLEAGEINGAIAQFQQAQKGAPVRIASLVALGRCFKAKRLYDLAVVQLNAARAELGPMDDLKKEVTYELGVCYELLGRPDAAIAEFKAVYSEDIGFRDVAEKINAFFAR
ncbi:MAG: tetratricopeptide repeat protein [Opitutus sp.]|nr:tetratricopeptide repeat protein [Opitutus sp.]